MGFSGRFGTMEQIPASIWTLTAGVVVTLISFWVGHHHGLLPEQASEQAPLVDNFFDIMLTIGTALFLVVQGAIILFVIRYRRRAGEEGDGLPVEGNLPLEAFWTAIPALIVIFLGIYSVDIFQRMGGLNPGDHTMHAMHTPKPAVAVVAEAPSKTTSDATALLAAAPTPEIGIGASPDVQGKAPDVVVDVAGMQYAWIFTYPDSGIVSGELHIPVGKDVQLNLSARDVIHSFWVPQFRLKQDAIPGVPTELRFKATKVGTYPVVCAELCGGYHGAMRTQVIVHTPEDFEAWRSQNQAIATTPVIPSLSDRHVEEMGVTPQLVAQVEAMTHHHSPAKL
ncbi:cytochrome c oxidase subunit II [Thermosynechococcus sp. CL-1]|nr:cytochrome c oxidase subunit II [Thermosynechococcus sp. CL-1]